MEQFFEADIDKRILKNALPLLRKLDRSKLRALRSDLRRNEELRLSVNSGKLPMETLVSLTFEELANEETKMRREKAKKENLLSALREKVSYTEEEFNILTNKIDDP